MSIAALAVAVFLFRSATPLHAFSDTSHQNNVERQYKADDWDAGVWISSPEKPYHSTTVDVPYNATKVKVRIKGSWYNHDRGIAETFVSSANLSASQLESVKKGEFSRGQNEGPGRFMWNPNGYLEAILKVDNNCHGRWGNDGHMVVFLKHRLIYKKYEGQGVSDKLTGEESTDQVPVVLSCQAPPWKLKGETYVKNETKRTGRKKSVTGEPGDRISFDHEVKNDSSVSMHHDAIINIDHAMLQVGKTPGGFHYSNPLGDSPKRGSPWQVFYNKTKRITHKDGSTTNAILASHGGQRICQRVAYSPPRSGAGGWGHSSWACVDVPYNYRLEPKVDVQNTYLTESDTSFTANGSITNHGPTYSRPVDYTVTRFVVPRSPTAPAMPTHRLHGQQHTAGGACAIAGQLAQGYGGAQHCQTVTSGNGQIATGTPKQLSAYDTIGSLRLKAGDRLCYMTTVNYYTHNHTARDYAYESRCAVVAKSPRVQIWGGDIHTDKDVRTRDTRVQGGNLFGSWAEYAIIANRNAQYSASGATLSTDGTGRQPATRHPLTIANTTTPGYANMTAGEKLPPHIGKETSIGQVPPSLASLPNGTYRATGSTIVLNGSQTIPANKRLVLKADTITIQGDIIYTDEAVGIGTIPQLVLVARKIIITPNVEQVDAWLLTTGSGGAISTCGTPPSGNRPSDGIDVVSCNRKLRINGPVSTSKLYLRRTYGAEIKPGMHLGTPAEIIHLRPDAYIAGHAISRSSGAIRTMYIRELPPRL